MNSPEKMAQTMINNMQEKTGKSLSEWLSITIPSVHEKHGQLVKWLKSEFGITHGFANLIAHKTLGEREGPAAENDLISQQYAGAKQGLKPIYEKLVQEIQRFGRDIEIAPKKTYVSIRRTKQFAIIQPSTKTRIDLGINLKESSPQGKLENSGSFNAMVSHRMRLQSIEDIDEEVIGWLREAYEQA